ncbi:MAG: hypothetical protein ACREQ5_12785 [Candidatus Dormibacteria bacterium]
MDGPKKIQLLKDLIKTAGTLWNGGTKLAGYDDQGPYHCQDCGFLRGRKEGNIFRDENGLGRCGQEVMKADPDTKKDSEGYPIVNIPKGCCEFVDNRGLVQIKGHSEYRDLYLARKEK